MTQMKGAPKWKHRRGRPGLAKLQGGRPLLDTIGPEYKYLPGTNLTDYTMEDMLHIQSTDTYSNGLASWLPASFVTPS